MTKLNKDNLRSSMRPKVRIKSIAKMQKEDPNNSYYETRIDDHYDPNGDILEDLLDAGWEPVVSTERLEDDRPTAPGSKKEESLRPKFHIRPGKGGAVFQLLKMPKEKNAELMKARADKSHIDTLTTLGKVEKQSGNRTRITGKEIDSEK